MLDYIYVCHRPPAAHNDTIFLIINITYYNNNIDLPHLITMYTVQCTNHVTYNSTCNK